MAKIDQLHVLLRRTSTTSSQRNDQSKCYLRSEHSVKLSGEVEVAYLGGLSFAAGPRALFGRRQKRVPAKFVEAPPVEVEGRRGGEVLGARLDDPRPEAGSARRVVRGMGLEEAVGRREEVRSGP